MAKQITDHRSQITPFALTDEGPYITGHLRVCGTRRGEQQPNEGDCCVLYWLRNRAIPDSRAQPPLWRCLRRNCRRAGMQPERVLAGDLPRCNGRGVARLLRRAGSRLDQAQATAACAPSRRCASSIESRRRSGRVHLLRRLVGSLQHLGLHGCVWVAAYITGRDREVRSQINSFRDMSRSRCPCFSTMPMKTSLFPPRSRPPPPLCHHLSHLDHRVVVGSWLRPLLGIYSVPWTCVEYQSNQSPITNHQSLLSPYSAFRVKFSEFFVSPPPLALMNIFAPWALPKADMPL
jgi:hypothetical protein